MVLYYYNTILQKNIMSKDLIMLSENLPHLGWLGYISPSFIYELFCQIWSGSNQMQLFKVSGRSGNLYQCMLLWLNEGNNLGFFIVISFGVFSAEKYYSWI